MPRTKKMPEDRQPVLGWRPPAWDGSRLRAFRVRNNMIQTELTDAVNRLLGSDYTKATISTWERGVEPRQYRITSALAHILEVDLEDFYIAE